MHVHCLHWQLVCFSRVLFANHVNPRLVKWLQFGSGDLTWLPLSVHVCLGLVVEYWSFVGACTRHTYSKLYYLHLLASLLKLLPPPTAPYIRWPNTNEFHQKIIKTGKSQPLSTSQVSCTKAKDN